MGAYVPLPGSKKLLMPSSRSAGPVDSSEIATVTVRVRSQSDTGALAKHAYAMASTTLDNLKVTPTTKTRRRPTSP